mgnify:CR=1 FL=1|tara:strand:- start:845 stop:1747 length:903 start_codon:yes stop_codon:yes gene_type:complete
MKKMKKIMILGAAVAAIFLTSCSADVKKLANDQGEKYLQELNEINQKKPLDNLILDYNNTVNSNESDINDLIISKDINGDDKSSFDKIISEKIGSTKEEISSLIQKKKQEGFDFLMNKTWVIQDKSDKDYYKSIFKVTDSILTFINIKGEYEVSLNEGIEKSKIGNTEVTLEKLDDNELSIISDSNEGVFIEATEEDLILGSFNGSKQSYYFSLNIKEPSKGKLYLKGQGGSKSYPLKITSKGNSRYKFGDRTGSFDFRFKNDRWIGKIPGLDLNMKRSKKESAYYEKSIFNGYTKEDAE